jgi:hypothetical protein
MRAERGSAMNMIETSILWSPKVLGKEPLDRRRWIYMVEAPFDMPSDIPDLIGMRVDVGDGEFEIRGVVPKMPPGQVRRGEAVLLLVVRH